MERINESDNLKPQAVLRVFPDRSAVVMILLAIVLTLSLAAAITAAALALWDNATVPTALTRAGIAFAGALSLGIAFIALVVSAWS
ncbi:hypothetical protein ABT255_17655 [Streptomyces mirabilis]|uniref:hypothetical protein n=1 Tax=Streptomyces mirabilis TaxID=68239 RepID=UPI00332E9956